MGRVKGHNMNNKSLPGSPALCAWSFTRMLTFERNGSKVAREMLGFDGKTGNYEDLALKLLYIKKFGIL